jgi:hypothetical protein
LNPPWETLDFERSFTHWFLSLLRFKLWKFRRSTKYRYDFERNVEAWDLGQKFTLLRSVTPPLFWSLIKKNSNPS